MNLAYADAIQSEAMRDAGGRYKEEFHMATRLVIEGNAFYEIDEDCMKRRDQKEREQAPMSQNQRRQTGGDPAALGREAGAQRGP